MTSLNKKLVSIIQELDLGDINETKKLSILDEIGEVLTQRIILRLIKEVPKEKKSLFVEKINNNKTDPDKVLLFIDHFVQNADELIDEEIDIYKNDLINAIKKPPTKS